MENKQPVIDYGLIKPKPSRLSRYAFLIVLGIVLGVIAFIGIVLYLLEYGNLAPE